jgi:hypothetical protein
VPGAPVEESSSSPLVESNDWSTGAPGTADEVDCVRPSGDGALTNWGALGGAMCVPACMDVGTRTRTASTGNFMLAENKFVPESTSIGVCHLGESALAENKFANCTSSKTADSGFGQLGELTHGNSQLYTPLGKGFKVDDNRRISDRRHAMALG